MFKKIPILHLVDALGLVVSDTQSDSIQCMNFAKKLFNSMFESILLTQNSIQTIIQIIINSDDSIQKSIQFNSQEIIDTGQMEKVPKNSPKSNQNRHKRGLFIKNGN